MGNPGLCRSQAGTPVDAYAPAVLTYDDHPLLHPAAFVARLPRPLGGLETPEWLAALLTLDADVPLQRSEELRAATRDLLRHGGYKPTGRGKPSAEYLVRAAGEGKLDPINPAVDVCNAVSLASGVPISVVDVDRSTPPLRVGLCSEGSYVFNASGQEIRLDGLLCLFDGEGPCANAVKDAQRTKTHAGTEQVLSVLWGPRAFAAEVEAALTWYRELAARAGMVTERVA